jgi:hypothetical protein
MLLRTAYHRVALPSVDYNYTDESVVTDVDVELDVKYDKWKATAWVNGRKLYLGLCFFVPPTIAWHFQVLFLFIFINPRSSNSSSCSASV